MKALLGKIKELKKFFTEERRQTIRGDLRSIGALWALFAVSLIFWEFFIKVVTGGSCKGTNMSFLLFIPALALFPTLLCGWLKEKWNRIAVPVVIGLINVFYMVQLGYYLIFGSLLSISLLGLGGNAMGDFGWTIKDIILDSICTLLLALLPTLEAITLAVLKKIPVRKLSVPMHLAAPVTGVVLWLIAVACLGLFGTGRQTPYYLYHSSLADTDTTSSKFGAAVTSIIEAKAYVLGAEDEPIVIPVLQAEGDVPAGSGGKITLGGKDKNRDTQQPVSSSLTASGDTVSVQPDAGADSDQGSDGTKASDKGTAVTVTTPPTPTAIPRQIDPTLDFASLAEQTEDASIRELCNYFSVAEGSSKNDYTGLLKDYNLIYICAESFWTYAIDETITPTLYKMANNGIILNNYYNSFPNTTTNGEFAMATGLWPDISRYAKLGKDVGSMPQSSDKYMPFGLGNIFKSLGGTAYGYHNFKGYYYKRNESWPNLGYDCVFMRDASDPQPKEMKFTTAWPTSDLEMMQQSVGDYVGDDHFTAYYMTFSGHGDYVAEGENANPICARNYEEAEALCEGRGYNSRVIGYFACHIELDKAMEYLLDELEKAGKLDNTLIVIAADHYPYYLNDAKMRKMLAGHKVDEDFEMYKSTCIMYCAGISEPIVSDEYCCNVDILPTVLNLLGIDYDSRLIAGTDVFDPQSLHKATLYNKSFVTEYVKYNAAKDQAIWQTDISDYTQDELDAYIDGVAQRVETEYAVSLKLMDTDFYRFIDEHTSK